MKINKHLVLCAFATALLAACTAQRDDLAASVNGVEISKKTYEATLDNLVTQQKQVNPNFADTEQDRLILGRMALEQLILNEVLAQKAEKENFVADKKLVDENMQNIRQRFAFNEDGTPITDEAQIDKKFKQKLKTDGITLKQLRKKVQKELNAKLFLKHLSDQQKVQLNEEALQHFYKLTQALVNNDKKVIQTLSQQDLAVLLSFAIEVKKATAPRATVSSIFLATPQGMDKETLAKKQELSKKLTQDLKNKKITFVEAIQQYSDDKNALRTNGEQTILKGSLPAELDKIVFEASVGKVLSPVTQPEGIYIIRVNEKRAENPLAYAQLRNDIIQYLATEQIKRNLQQQTKGLISEATVKIFLPQYSLNEAAAAPAAAAK